MAPFSIRALAIYITAAVIAVPLVSAYNPRHVLSRNTVDAPTAPSRLIARQIEVSSPISSTLSKRGPPSLVIKAQNAAKKLQQKGKTLTAEEQQNYRLNKDGTNRSYIQHVMGKVEKHQKDTSEEGRAKTRKWQAKALHYQENTEANRVAGVTNADYKKPSGDANGWMNVELGARAGKLVAPENSKTTPSGDLLTSIGSQRGQRAIKTNMRNAAAGGQGNAQAGRSAAAQGW